MLISCESKAPIEVKQITSKETVVILPNLKNPLVKDSVSISVPIEFEILLNSSKVRYITWNYIVDGKSLYDDVFDYQVYNKQNKNKFIHQLNFDLLPKTNKINIILKEKNHLISKNKASELMRKYNINSSLDNLKFGDTIKLATYDKFRQENKNLIDDFNKINDSISFKVTRGEKYFLFVDKKINW
ncbi:hypothetical protein B4N84_23395 [Flavobacterium sp. IR1]|nr:hypothetical protein B4N84_23395 [Flavobacterium sp. IR1]